MQNDENVKVCSKCGRELPLSDFYKHPRHADGLQGECKMCHNERSRERHRKALRDPGKNHRYLVLLRNHRSDHPELTHDLTREKFDELCQVKFCPICGREMVDFAGPKNPRLRSFDRILNDVGLTDKNTWVICYRCNRHKGDLSGKQLLNLANKIIQIERELNEQI